MRLQPYHDQMNTSSYQLKLRAKVHEISKTFSRNYTYIGTVADYQNIKPNMTDLDKAKYFTLKKYMDQAYKPMAEFQAAREVIDKIDGGYIKDEYKKLSENPEFKECMRKHGIFAEYGLLTGGITVTEKSISCLQNLIS